MEMAKVTSKGQITIPISIRKRLKINEGEKLLFIDRPDGVMMVNPALLESSQGADGAVSKSYGKEKSKAKPIPAGQAKQSVAASQEVSQTAADKPDVPDAKPPLPEQKSKPATTAKDFNLDALLDEIRSIGSI